MLNYLSKNKLKYLRSLKLNKFRQMYNNFTVEGEKMVLELLNDPNTEMECIICTEAWYEQFRAPVEARRVEVWIAKTKELEQISALKSATSVVGVVKKFASTKPGAWIKEDLSLYLDCIQNPGNLGTMLRIADWFGIRTVFASLDSVDLYNPKVIQSTMGAFLRVQYIKIEFAQLRSQYPDLPVYGTVLEGDNLFEADLSSHGIIVIGNEGRGISPEVQAEIDHPLAIPAHPRGGAESLNAAVAAGIVCARFRYP